MNPNWAEENLQTIRTLMERSALYRRALAPLMLMAGALGVAATAAGRVFHLDTTRAFGLLWLTTAAIAVVGAFFIVRRQALKENEAFWSAPTRHVTQALLPPLTAGLCIGLILVASVADARSGVNSTLALLWLLFYGCALHAAGFFMPRGIKIFGWICLVFACIGGVLMATEVEMTASLFYYSDNAHWLMGFFFGALHLAYGVYLYFTEKKTPAA